MWSESMRGHMQDLLRQFVDTGDEVSRGQEHLQGLLAAVVSLAEDLSLEAVLNRLVRSACELVGARYGALGVIGDGQFSHFITSGLDEEETRLIGDLPAGQGLLGHLLREPVPLRLHDIGGHPMAAGFPENHPSMESFLGVPVRVGDTIFGNLYLTEKTGGQDFTAEDEDLAVALAAAAGAAIRNAGVFDDTARRQRWMEAETEVSDRLALASNASDTGSLNLVAEGALHASASVLAVIASPTGEGTLTVRTSAGGRPLAAGRDLRASATVAGVLQTGVPVTAAEASEVFDPATAEKLGPVLIIALGSNSTVNGVLVLARAAGDRGYRGADAESGAIYATKAGLALDLLRANRLRDEHVLFTDRDRIARDLHDLVIQRLFAAGLSLQSLRRYTTDPAARARIGEVTVELDETIRQLRDTIYYSRAAQAGNEPLTARVLRTVQGLARSAGFTPKVQLSGPVDETVPDAVAEQLLPVLSEALSNAARHSGAEEISVSLTARPGQVALLVTDNGCGFQNPTKLGGLENMKHRALGLGGHCVIESTPGRGTHLKWTAPTRN